MSYRPPKRRLAPLQPSSSTGFTPGFSQQAGDTPHKPKRVACKECRQAKLRCDSSNNGAGNPCVRCRRLSLACQIETSYKRVSKRLKINELAEEVERLRSAIDRRGTDASPNSASNGSTGSSSTAAQPLLNFQPQPAISQQSSTTLSETQRSPAQTVPNASPSVFGFSTASTSRSLDHINIDKDRINDLFQVFFTHYHPYFDILDPIHSPDEYYSRSPLLFWSVIVIAARQYQYNATLYSELTPSVTKLVWSAISALPHTRFVVQAILLLSVWPFPTNSMSTDPSFILVSIAKSASMQLGLHRPEIIQDFRRVKTRLSSDEFQCTIKTWVGGFIAAQSVTTSIGQSSVIHADWVIEAACETNSKYIIPENLRHHLLLSKYITRINCVMAEDKRSETGYPLDRDICVLMNVLEQDLIDLEVQIGRNLSEIHLILLAMSSLQLRTYYFFVSTNHDFRRQGLLKAYTTSLNLISRVSEANEKFHFVKYAPNGYSQFLVMAAILLMKIIHSSYAKYIDTGSGKRAFDSVLWMFRNSSIEDNDIRGRVSKILTNLWSFHQSCSARSILEEPKLNIKTRLGASLLHDSLWTWREEFGGQRDALRTAIPQASDTVQMEGPEHIATKNSNIDVANSETMISQTFPQDNFNSADSMLEETNFNFDTQDIDWLWDVGFPSFLPMEVGSYQQSPPGW